MNGFDLKAAFNAKMLESRISPDVAKKLKFKPLSADEVPKDTPFQEPAILIPYFDLAGAKTDFWRLRYLKQPELKGFAVQAKHKPLKYVQPSKTLNELYLPPIIDWEEVAADTLMPLLITEGEFKAACACEHTSYPCIGLGGVWSWKSAKKKVQLIEGFDDFKWDQRPVYIVYDSDAVTNPLVMQAENALAKVLTNLGAEPHVVRLPPGHDGEKMGLDDFIVHRGVDTLEELLEESEPWIAAVELHRLNEEVLYVRDPGLIFRLDNMQRMSVRSFIDHAYSTRTYFEEVATAKSVQRVKKFAPKEWIQWPSRAEVSRITYAPGEERITAKRELNIWPGWGCEPQEGDITPWNDLLDFLFHDNPKSRQWFERWLAFPLQYPGTKMYSSPVVWGLCHGTGKSLVGYTMGKIYNKNFIEINDAILHGAHNEWAENKQFVMGDEISTGDKRAASDRMKTMITQKLLWLNPKYIPGYSVPDVINYYFTSNHPDSFFIEDDDRRFFVHEVKGMPLPMNFYHNYEAWMGKYGIGPGIPALFYHLLNLDMGDFSSEDRALLTKDKLNMMNLGRSDLGSWVYSLKNDPEFILQAGGHLLSYSLFRTETLLELYDPDGKSRVSVTGMARELSRQGFEKAADGHGIQTQEGRVKAWIVRDKEHVISLSWKELGEFYDKERGRGKGQPPKKSKLR
jgi:hypothetical protein